MGWDIRDFFPIENEYAEVAEVVNTGISLPIMEELTVPQTNMLSETLIISSSESPSIQQWKGTYQMIFFPTIENELEIIRGTLFIGEGPAAGNNDPCKVVFEFFTGKESIDHTPSKKTYNGTLVLSSKTHTAHMTLTWPEFGEITYLSIIDPVTAAEGIECAIGLALTVSAGMTRVPTSHRIIICREIISDDCLSLIRGMLFMNESDILISEESYFALLSDPRIPNSCLNTFLNPLHEYHKAIFPKAAQFFRLKEDIVNAADIKSEDKLLFLTVLREYSLSRKYLKLGHVVSEDLYKLLRYLHVF